MDPKGQSIGKKEGWMTTARVILNPFSGRGDAGRQKEHLIAALTDAEIKHELIPTEGPRHAIDLAREGLEQGFSPILRAIRAFPRPPQPRA